MCARSVKLLSTIVTEEEELDERDKWWLEIRNEIRSHMKSLSCNIVLGYSETKSIYEDICVLSGLGTAALVDESFFSHSLHLDKIDYLNQFNDITIRNCSLCHVPYSESELPFPVSLSHCNVCATGLVPDIIMTSIQPIPEIEIVGQGTLLRAVVTRPHKKTNGEISAKKISDYLPFMEYEIHRQLLGKLKLKGMNMIYGLRVQISIGENLLIGLAEATACKVAPLPGSIIPKIMNENSRDKTSGELEEIEKLNKLFNLALNENKQFFNLNSTGKQLTRIDLIEQSSNDVKGFFKIDLDDVRDKDEVYMLFDSTFSKKKGIYACNTE